MLIKAIPYIMLSTWTGVGRSGLGLLSILTRPVLAVSRSSRYTQGGEYVDQSNAVYNA